MLDNNAAAPAAVINNAAPASAPANTPAPASVPQGDAGAAAPAAAAPEKTLREVQLETIARVFSGDKDANGQPRRPNGQWDYKANPEGPPADGAAPAAPPAPAVPAVAAPQFWTAEGKELWGKLPPEAHTYIAQREQQIQQGFSNMGRAAKVGEAVMDVAQRHADFIRQSQVPVPEMLEDYIALNQAMAQNPAAAIRNLAKAAQVDLMSEVLGPDPIKALRAIAQHAGVDLLDVALADPATGQMPAQQQRGDIRSDPYVRSLEEKLLAIEQRTNMTAQELANQRAAEEQARANQYHAVVDNEAQQVASFAASRPDFRQLEGAIATLIPQVQAQNPGLPSQQVLDKAYDMARWADPTTRAALLAEQTKTAQAATVSASRAHATQARQAGAVNVNGAPPSPPGMPANLRDAQMQTLRRLGYGG